MQIPNIDYQKISDAKRFYELHGFSEISVPWIIGHHAYSITCPIDPRIREFYTLGGYLVASAEQSFIELILQGVSLGRHCAITPCFRDEPMFDGLHQSYFMKLELIDTDVSVLNLRSIITLSQHFFNHYVPTNIVQTDKNGHTFDIVDKKHGIELGSYGIRKYGNFSWIYGTGIALPRLDTVILKQEE
jgi:hypothetical protein